MKRLKVGYFIDTFFPMVDGVIMVVDNYAKRMQKYADVTVFAPKVDLFYKDTFDYKVIRSMSLPVPFFEYSLPNPDVDISFRNELNKSALDIVHIHSPFAIGRMGIRYAYKKNIPVLGTMHSQYKKDFQRRLKVDAAASALTDIVANCFDKCDRCYAVNAAVAKIFYEEYGCRELPGVIGNATDMLPCDKENACREIHGEYKINEDEKVLVFVGRINKLKNIMFIADTLAVLKKKGLKFKMLFVGTGEDELELKNKIHMLGLENCVIFCGKISEREKLAKIYAASDIFLFPSLYDASSLVQIEAASQGLPTAFLSGAATAATVTDGVNAMVADEKDYADSVLKTLSDSSLHKTLSEGAKRDLYVTWDDVVEKVYGEYVRYTRKYV